MVEVYWLFPNLPRRIGIISRQTNVVICNVDCNNYLWVYDNNSNDVGYSYGNGCMIIMPMDGQWSDENE